MGSHGSSTQEAILAVTKDWFEVLDNLESIGCVFSDLSKVFDRLPHWLVLVSLSRCGVTGALLRWFENYLQDRMQHVVLDIYTVSQQVIPDYSVQGCCTRPVR